MACQWPQRSEGRGRAGDKSTAALPLGATPNAKPAPLTGNCSSDVDTGLGWGRCSSPTSSWWESR